MVWFVLCLNLLLTPCRLFAAEPSEQTLKAAFLYYFTLYTAWPELPAAYNICILGEDSLGKAMEPIARKEIAGRPIRVTRLKEGSPLSTCHLLFIAASEHDRTSAIIKSLAGRPVLTVAEAGNYDPKLIMLRMSFEQGVLIFEANPSAAKAAGLIFSAKMLHLARRIY
jgi:hypothetical protein